MGKRQSNPAPTSARPPAPPAPPRRRIYDVGDARIDAVSARDTTTLPRHKITMLLRAAEELLNVTKDNRDSLVATYGDENDQVKHPEEAHTLAELEFEIARAERAIQSFYEVFRG